MELKREEFDPSTAGRAQKHLMHFAPDRMLIACDRHVARGKLISKHVLGELVTRVIVAP
jgi:hypothetical protein